MRLYPLKVQFRHIIMWLLYKSRMTHLQTKTTTKYLTYAEFATQTKNCCTQSEEVTQTVTAAYLLIRVEYTSSGGHTQTCILHYNRK